MKRIILILLSAMALQACNKVDDYLLGKDNSPKPTALEQVTPKLNLVKKWSSPVGKSQQSTAYLKLKPVIIGQTIYTSDKSGLVEAINKADAKPQWSQQLDHAIVSGPAVMGNYIALATDASTVVLLNRKNGERLWEKKLSSEVLAKPAMTQDKLIAKTIDGNLYALNIANGEKIWVVNHGAPNLILKAGSSPVIVDDKVLAGYSDGKLDAVDLHTGRVLWQRSIAYAKGASDVERLVDIDADPIVKNNVAYLATYQGYIGALSLTNGQFIWNKEASVYKNIALSRNNVYITDSDDILWALDAKTGKVKWKQTALKSRGLTEPVIMGNRLVVGDKEGILHILTTQTGDFLARTQLTGSVNISPVVENDSIFVQTANGLLNKLSVS